MPPEARGTFAGLAHPAMIEHFKRLGVTTIELMPADVFVDERHLPPLGLSNAWGYNPVVLGAPASQIARVLKAHADKTGEAPAPAGAPA